MTVQLGNCLLQHLAVGRLDGGLELLRETLPRKKQALASPVTLLLAGRQRGADSFPLL
ncbi:MAG: hypothetical protein WBQ43_11085 [Terriglobales bacterium]